MKQQEPIGHVQLEILQYIADHHPISVGKVAEHFAETQGKARTTILTVMEKLREKGYLSRKRISRVYQYSPKVPKNEVMVNVVQRFVEESLGGSVSPFIAYLAKSGKLTKSELSKLEQLARELDKQAARKRK